MDKDIDDLKLEIKVLNKRIADLEGIEKRRSFFRKIKLLFNIIMFISFIYGLYYGYSYIKALPDTILDNIKELPDTFVDDIIKGVGLKR